MKPPIQHHSALSTMRAKHHFFITALAVLFLVVPIQKAISQTVSTSTGTVKATATVQPVPQVPFVASANQTAAEGVPGATPLAFGDEIYSLYDGLVRELRNGGYVLYMRHGSTLASTQDRRGPGAWWTDCNNTLRLSPEAQPRARAIGEALQKQRIVVSEVLTSEFCRTYDTAVHLGLSAPTKTAALNDVLALDAQRPLSVHVMGIQELLGRVFVAPKINRLLVGHNWPVDSVHPALATLKEGHIAIFRAEGGTRFHYITTLSPGQWQWVGRQTVPDTATQTVYVTQPAATTAAPTPVPPPAPLIDPAKEIKGVALVQALRRGGYNLYMRHAQSNVGQDGNLLATPMWWENCAIQRNISDMGKEQAKKVGSSIKALKIPVDSVLTAQFCRTRETGHNMGLGPIEITEDINHQIGQRVGFDINISRFKRLADMPTKGSNTLLISHTHGSPRNEERIMGGITEAEIVVYKPDGKGGAEPIARIPPPEWDNLAKLMAELPATENTPKTTKH